MKHLFTTLLFILPLLSAIAQNEKDLPSLVLKDLDGKEVNIRDVVKEGRITIIDFWATWCTPCKKELENLNELLEDWSDKYKVDLIGITIDNATNAVKVKPYVNGKGWEFPVLLDVNSDSKRSFNFSNIPFTVIIDQNKKVAYSHTSYIEGDELILEEEIKKLVK